MRAMALLALMAAALFACQRSNPEYCTVQNAPCENGQICRLANLDASVAGADGGMTGPGRCVQRECQANTDCHDDKSPVCDNATGQCTSCSGNGQCQSRGGGTPYCSAGACVACASNADCPGQVCDPTTFQCRGCRLHNECGDQGVCVKDASFASMGQAVGSCIPASQIIVVDAGNPQCDQPPLHYCTAADGLMAVSAARPYLRLLSGAGEDFSGLSLGPFPQPIPIYLIGPMADSDPWTAQGNAALLTLGNDTATFALNVAHGALATVEGVVVTGLSTANSFGIECTGNGTAGQTSLRILRSIITGNSGATGVSTSNQCGLVIDQTWIGRGMTPGQSVYKDDPGNATAVAVGEGDLDIRNSVFWDNGVVGVFGGVRVHGLGASNTARIINSTFVTGSVGAAGEPLSVFCQDLVPQFAILNSIFYWDVPAPRAAMPSHINSNCIGHLAALASDDPSLPQGTIPVVPTTANQDPAGFQNSMQGDFRLGPTTPASIKSGGVAHYSNKTYQTDAPTYDLQGTPRPVGSISIGAFQYP